MTSLVDVQLRWTSGAAPDSGPAHYQAHQFVAEIGRAAQRPLFAAAWPTVDAPAYLRLRVPGMDAAALAREHAGIVLPAYPTAPTVGQRYRFVLTANPTMQRDRKRDLIRTEDGVLAWLADRAGTRGFAVEDVDCTFLPSLTFRKAGTPGRVTLSRVRYAGTLSVTDLSPFHQTMISGIGRGKGLGLGMLILLPAA